VTFRGFVAVDIPPSPSLERFAEQLHNASASLKVVSTNRLHLTVKFLGDTEEGLVPEIEGAAREACADIRPFEITVRGTGAFPSLSRMNVVWVGVEGAEAIGRESLGFAAERRPWKAHVTLARVKGHRDLDRVRGVIEAHRDDVFGHHRVDRIYLKKSVLTPAGAQYSIVSTVVFGE